MEGLGRMLHEEALWRLGGDPEPIALIEGLSWIDAQHPQAHRHMERTGLRYDDGEHLGANALALILGEDKELVKLHVRRKVIHA